MSDSVPGSLAPRVVALGAMLLLGASFPAGAADTVTCERTVEAFDRANPSQLIGHFDPPTTLEIEGADPEGRMLRVLYRAPDGRQVRALCRAADLNVEVTLAEKANGAGKGEAPALGMLRDFSPSIWETSFSDFAAQHRALGFQPVASGDNREIRSGRPLQFLDRPVYEALARFQNEKLQELSLLFFGRGDAGREMDEKEFQETIKGLGESLDRWVGSRGLDAWVPVSATDTRRRSWFRAPVRLDLEWCTTRGAREARGGFEPQRISFRTEFIRLVARAFDGKGEPSQLVKPNYQGRGLAAIRRSEAKERVKRGPGGDVWIEGIPMVDQGMKGYCVCATAERVLRYYGIEVDQNELAKEAGAQTTGGTNPNAMARALRQLTSRFSLQFDELISFDAQKFQNELRAYNQVARKNKVPEIHLPQGGIVIIQEVFQMMDPASFLEMRQKKTNDRVLFLGHVRGYVDKGAPLLWGVQLGMVPEQPALPQQGGGHMRLIIGYNEKTGEILYSDSWGAGHEMKRMSLDHAFAITTGLSWVLPSN